MNLLLMLAAVAFIALLTWLVYLAYRHFGLRVQNLLSILLLTRVSSIVILLGDDPAA